MEFAPATMKGCWIRYNGIEPGEIKCTIHCNRYRHVCQVPTVSSAVSGTQDITTDIVIDIIVMHYHVTPFKTILSIANLAHQFSCNATSALQFIIHSHTQITDSPSYVLPHQVKSDLPTDILIARLLNSCDLCSNVLRAALEAGTLIHASRVTSASVWAMMGS